jgi:hypothetical protein
MKNIYRKLSLAALAAGVLGTTAINAQTTQTTIAASDFTKVGLSGGQFLKIGVGARGTGMAGAHSAVANDVTSIFWNPAGLASVKGYAADISQTFWFAGMSHNFASAVIPVGEKYRFAASFTSLSSGDIKITTMDQQDGTGGIYNVNDIALGLTLAGNLTDQFSFGVTAKYVQQAFTNVSSGGFVFDLGTRYNTGYKGIVLGFSINSLGTQQSFDGADLNRANNPVGGINTQPVDMRFLSAPFDMPLSFRAGIGTDLCKGAVWEPEIDADGVQQHSLVTALDFETFSDVPEQFAAGFEYTWKELLSVRGGYRFGSDQFGVAGGIGIKYVGSGFDGQIDYSVNPSQSLGLINRVSVALKFN